MKKIIQYIKDNKQDIIKITFVALFLLGVFYWYEYRPMRIKKGCMRATETTLMKQLRADRDDLKYYYWKCKEQRGL